MAKDSLAFTPAIEVAKLIRERKLSPVEVVESLLRRIGDLNPKLNAYLTVVEGEALSAARQAERIRGKELPPLHGVPVSIKDLNFTRGIRTTSGSLIYKDYVPEEDDVAVTRLRNAGAIILGKTNTPEFGLKGTTENRLGDDCRNPWNPERVSGGSSGGAAVAVATGLGPLALGSDGAGSIRIPSGFCGVYGIKATHGRVPHYGGFGSMPMFADSGPLSRTVADAALMLGVLAGHDPRDVLSLREEPPDFLGALEGSIQGLRVAWSPDLGYARVDPEVRSVAESAARTFESLGCHLDEATPDIEYPFTFFTPIVLADSYAALGHLLEEHAEDLTSYAKEQLEYGRRVTGQQYSQALRSLERFRYQMADFFQRYDLLLTPTNAVPAFPHRQPPREVDGHKVNLFWGASPFTASFNITGQPAASAPCGFSKDGLPIGLHIIGRWGDEVTVLRASAAFEKACPWADRKPPLA